MSTTWVVILTFPGKLTPQELDKLEDQHDATAANTPAGHTLTFYADAPNPLAALSSDPVAALLPKADAVEILTETAYAKRANAPTLPELVGANEAAAIVEVTRQRIHQLATTHPDFPAPVYRLAMGPVWVESAVRAFAKGYDRRPGRRANPVDELVDQGLITRVPRTSAKHTQASVTTAS